MFSSNAKSYAFRPRPGDLPENSPAYTGSMVDRSELLLILLISVGVITLCSRSSFLYPLNNWDDANCFFTVGKSMFNGKVPYRDLIEQKGPLLYFLHGLAWLISNVTFLGVYFLEIIAAFFFLFYSYQIATLLLSRKCGVLIPLIAAVTYISIAFEQGDSAEELCLPLLSFSLWIITKYTLSDRFSGKEFLLLGFAAGCVFWIKFSLIGMYLGWYFVFLINSMRRKDTRRLLFATGMIACGVALATLPWMLYFGFHHAMKDWVDVYLFDNLFVYTNNVSAGKYIRQFPILDSLLLGAFSFLRSNPVTFIACAAIVLLGWKERFGLPMIGMIIGAVCLIYIGGRRFRYYSLIMNVFLAPATAMLLRPLVLKKAFRFLEKTRWILAVCCLICAFLFTPNRYFMHTDPDSLAQYQFRDIIQSESENATLLNYGFLDAGFYTVCNTVPNCKAFCGLNIALGELSELQNYYVENGLCDYIITRSAENPEFELYDCIAECASDYSFGQSVYRLYRLKAASTQTANPDYMDTAA